MLTSCQQTVAPEPSWNGGEAPAHVRQNFFVVPLHFFPLQIQLDVLVSAFLMVSTVWSVFWLLFFYSRCPPCRAISKSGVTCPPCPMESAQLSSKTRFSAPKAALCVQRKGTGSTLRISLRIPLKMPFRDLPLSMSSCTASVSWYWTATNSGDWRDFDSHTSVSLPASNSSRTIYAVAKQPSQRGAREGRIRGGSLPPAS